MEIGEAGDGPEAKRRKSFTKRETLQKLDELGNNVSMAVSEMVSDLSPFDVNDENVNAFEDRIDKLDQVASSLTRKIYRLKEEVKAKKYRRKDHLLDENLFSCSQHSVLQSSQEESDNLSEVISQPMDSGTCAKPSATYK